MVVFYVIQRKKIILTNSFAFITFLAFISIGIASVTFGNDLNKKNHYSTYLSNPTNTAVLTINKVLKPSRFYNSYYATVTSLNSKKTQGKIVLRIEKDSITTFLDVGNRIFICSSFTTINAPQNPYQFSYKNYLITQQIYHQVSIKNSAYLLLKRNSSSLKSWAFFIRKKINIGLKKYGFKGDELAIINALLLGQRQEISKNLLQNYQNAGAIHLLAVSGLHIGIILLFLSFLLQPLEKLKHGEFIKLFLIVILLWCFAIIAGLSASIVRAVTMFTAIAIVTVLNQEKNIYKALIVSVFFLLLFNSYYLFNIGFQLSYLAVFFIVWIQPMLSKLWSPSLKIVNYFWQLITVSIAAQIGVLPLSLFYFHQFPGLFFVANLLIIPFLGIILGIGILIIVLALLDILPNFMVLFYEKVIMLLNSIVSWIGNQEAFLFQNISFTAISIGFYFLGIILIFKWIETKKPLFLKFTLFVIIGFQCYLITEKYLDNTNNEFIVFNKTKHTIIGIRKGDKVQIHHTLDSLTLKNERSIKAYLIGSRTQLNPLKTQPKDIYSFNNHQLFVIDSLGVYPTQNFSPTYILLRASPSINLDRLLNTLHPSMVIADASNYKSYISLWKKTCKNHNIKFYYTVIDGAFIEKF